MVVDKDRIRKVLKETVLALCQTGMDYNVELCVEGLLGITLDQKDVILVNINEVVRPDLPRDLSIGKRSSEKRKAESDVVNNNTVHSMNYLDNSLSKSNSNKKVRQIIIEPDFNPECSVMSTTQMINGEESIDSSVSLGTLRMPIIPPEHGYPQLPYRDRRKQITNVTEKHMEITRILGNAQKKAALSSAHELGRINHEILNAYANNERKEYSKIYSQDNDSLPGNDDNRIFTAKPNMKERDLQVRKHEHSQENIIPQPVRAASLFNSFLTLNNEKSINHVTSASGATSVCNQSPYSYSPVNTSVPNSIGFSNEAPPIGLVVNTNVQPPTPLAVVAGTGMLQPIEITKSTPVTCSTSNTPDNHSYTTPRKDGSGSSSHAMSSYLSPEACTVKLENQTTPTTSTGSNRGSKEFRRFRCTLCPASSSRKFNLQRHMKSHHPGFGESYILDLTPKERGGQVMKINDKLSPCGSSGGYLYNDPNFVNDELSNNSDMAMDLSSQTNNEFEILTNSPGEEGSSSSSTSSKYNKVNSHMDSNAFSKNNFGNGSAHEGLATEPIKSNKVAVRLGRSEGTRPRKGLDQVLFSKFGCYTEMNEGKQGSNEININNHFSQLHSAFMIPSSKIVQAVTKAEPDDSSQSNNKSLDMKCLSLGTQNDSQGFDKTVSQKPAIAIPTTVIEDNESVVFVKDKDTVSKNLKVLPDDDNVGEKLKFDMEVDTKEFSSELPKINGSIVNKITTDDTEKKSSEESNIDQDVNKETNEHMTENEKSKNVERQLITKLAESHFSETCHHENKSDKGDRKNENDQLEKNLEIPGDTLMQECNETTKTIIGYVFKNNQTNEEDVPNNTANSVSNNTKDPENSDENDPHSKLTNDEISGSTSINPIENHDSNELSENNPDFIHQTSENMSDINHIPDDGNETDTVDSEHSGSDDEFQIQESTVESETDTKYEVDGGDDEDVLLNDENDNEEGRIKLKVLRSVRKRSSDIGIKQPRVNQRETSMRLRTRSKSGSKAS